MSTDLSFKQVREILKADKVDSKLLEAVDALLGFALLVTPFVLGIPPSAATAGLGLLTTKNELTKIGKFALSALCKKDPKSIVTYQRMEAAHVILFYASFFEAVDEQLPGIWKTLGINAEDKQGLIERFEPKAQGKDKESGAPEKAKRREDLYVPFPNPTNTFKEHTSRVKQLYSEMAKGMLEFLSCLRVVNSDADRAVHTLAEIRPLKFGRYRELSKSGRHRCKGGNHG